MHTLSGDLLQLALEGRFDVIIHGCNCHCQGDISKLGTISFAEIDRNGHAFHVVNGYTQFHWRGNGVKADYDAIRSVMRTVRATFPGKRIGYPRIGAGLAGGDWDVIRAIIEEELAEEDHTCVEYVA